MVKEVPQLHGYFPKLRPVLALVHPKEITWQSNVHFTCLYDRTTMNHVLFNEM